MDDVEPAGEAAASYRRLRHGQLAAVGAALEDHIGRLDWSRDRIQRYRTQRLRSLLAYAVQRSPFHARRLQGIDPITVDIVDLARLPVMTKADAQDHWDTIVTDSQLRRNDAERVLAEQKWFSYTPGGQQIFSSGGSSGVRGVYVWDWEFTIAVTCLAWRMQAHAERQATPTGAPARLAVLAAGAPPHASTPLFDVPTSAGMSTVVIAAGAPFDEVLSAVQAADPTHLVGYSTVIAKLARAALSGRLRVQPQRVSTNSEPLTGEDRAAITAAWDVAVHNLWGSTEIGVQAVGCGFGEGLHVCEDEVVLERVDENGAVVPDGAPAARTLATGLANRTFPFIRYDLGDQVTTLAGDCPCGSAFARLADIDGRRDDDFRYSTTTVPASAFRHVLGTDPHIVEYQVIQTAGGAEVLLVGTPDVDTVAGRLIAALRQQGLADAVVEIQVVPAIGRHEASGKLKRFVPLR